MLICGIHSFYYLLIKWHLKHVLASGNGLEREDKNYLSPFSALKAIQHSFWLAELLCHTWLISVFLSFSYLCVHDHNKNELQTMGFHLKHLHGNDISSERWPMDIWTSTGYWIQRSVNSQKRGIGKYKENPLLERHWEKNTASASQQPSCGQVWRNWIATTGHDV